MNEKQIFKQWQMWRGWLLELLKELPDEEWDKIPRHHANNIRWNAGHILVGWDHTICTHFKQERLLPLNYHMLFPRESRPDDWTEEPPTKRALLMHLEQQPDRLIELSKNKLDSALEEPFLHMRTLGEMFLFHISHEALHLSAINMINKANINARHL